MSRRRWFFHVVTRSLLSRKGRTLLLVVVLAMASSLVTSLGIVSASMEKRIAEEIRRYGANMVVVPDTAGIEVGTGGMNFGTITDPAYLNQREVEQALTQLNRGDAAWSASLRGTVQFAGRQVAVDGVDFAAVRGLFPWWRIQGAWPERDGAVVGTDLALRHHIKPGDQITLTGPQGAMEIQVTGVVSTGGDEDRLIFLNLPSLQQLLGLPGQVSTVRVLVTGDVRRLAGELQPRLAGAKVKEVRQVARTSESVLKKVQLLMLLVMGVVVIACSGSVAGTMSSSVLERGKEIGLLKAMGASRREVLLLFGAESVLLGMVGGLAGYGAGCAIAFVVTWTVFSVPAEFLPAFLPVAFAVSCLIALVGSGGPMISVYRLDPVCSLRGE